MIGLSEAAILSANAAVMLAVFVQAVIGFGFAMIAAPLLAIIDIRLVPGTVIILLVCQAAVSGWHDRRHIDRTGLRFLIPGIVIGTWAAIPILASLSSSGFDLVFGLLLFVVLGIIAFGRLPKPRAGLTAAGGFASGFMGTISGIHGPPLALLYHHAPIETARATIALNFMLAGLTSLAFLSADKLLGVIDLQLSLALLPGLVVGLLVAIKGRHWVPVDWLRRGMQGLIAVCALMLIWRGLS